MKKWIFGITLLIFAAICIAANVLNYNEQGGARTVIGGSLDVVNGGDLDIESGGAFKMAGTQVTATAAELNKLSGATPDVNELNKLDGLTADVNELNKLDGLTADVNELNRLDNATPGSTVAGKALVVDDNNDIGGIRNLTVLGVIDLAGQTITDNGASGVADFSNWTGYMDDGVQDANDTIRYMLTIKVNGTTYYVPCFTSQ